VTPRDPRPPRRPAALRAVLFDMDGLLVDSEPLWFEAERAVMARLGGQWGEADQQALIGGSLDRTVSRLLAKAAAPASRRDVARRLVAEMAALILARGLPLQPGAGSLLTALDAAGVPYALVTASSRAIMDAVLTVTALSFSVTVCGEDVRRGKPDPEPYLLAAARLGVPAAGCVVLEDSPTGIAAARAAGCPVIAVPSVPVPPGPGLITMESLEKVGIDLLEGAVTGNFDGPGQLVTEEF
jgi:HAD superfamily hydrolase (TIGR01509 family)